MPWTLVFVLIIFVPLAGINYYIGRKVLRALAELTSWNRKCLRIFGIGVHLFVNLLPIAYLVAYLVAGRAAIPAFAGDNFFIDLLLSYPFWIALVIFVQLFLLYVILYILEFAVIRFVPSTRQWWQRRNAVIVTVLLCSVGVYSIVTVVRDTWTVRVVERDVSLPEEFKSLRGFRLAQISDVQGDGRTTYGALRRYVDKVNSLHPDLVLFAGDLVTSGTLYIDSTAEAIGHFKSKYGTIAALGDHDIFSNKPKVLTALERHGVWVIEDSTVVLRVDSSRIALSVVTYTYPQRPTTSQLEKISEDIGGAYRILLVHQPAESLVEFARQKGYHLLLAGHTHGGGLAFGVPGLFLVAPANSETKYVSGLYHAGQMVVSVTNGLGLTLAPVRFHAPAEIVVVSLR